MIETAGPMADLQAKLGGLAFIEVWDGFNRYEVPGVFEGINVHEPAQIGQMWRDKNEIIHVQGGTISAGDNGIIGESGTVDPLELPRHFTGPVYYRVQFSRDPITAAYGPDTSGAYHWVDGAFMYLRPSLAVPPGRTLKTYQRVRNDDSPFGPYLQPGMDITLWCVCGWVMNDGLIINSRAPGFPSYPDTFKPLLGSSSYQALSPPADNTQAVADYFIFDKV